MPALHARDCEPSGFEWLVGDDADASVYAFLRREGDGGPPLMFIANFTPELRTGYRVGAPLAGAWREVLNTDAEIYGGTNVGNQGAIATRDAAAHGRAVSLEVTLPPLGAIVLEPSGSAP